MHPPLLLARPLRRPARSALQPPALRLQRPTGWARQQPRQQPPPALHPPCSGRACSGWPCRRSNSGHPAGQQRRRRQQALQLGWRQREPGVKRQRAAADQPAACSHARRGGWVGISQPCMRQRRAWCTALGVQYYAASFLTDVDPTCFFPMLQCLIFAVAKTKDVKFVEAMLLLPKGALHGKHMKQDRLQHDLVSEVWPGWQATASCACLEKRVDCPLGQTMSLMHAYCVLYYYAGDRDQGAARRDQDQPGVSRPCAAVRSQPRCSVRGHLAACRGRQVLS